MLASVRTKTLLLAFAFDETYGYIRRIGRDEQNFIVRAYNPV